MKVLILGDPSGALELWLTSQGESVLRMEMKINPDCLREWDPAIVVSYNYPYILRKEILSYPPLGCINLHISLLPWNRGADPNIWSHLMLTPKGVTVHYMDEGVDTGDIIGQEEVIFDEEDTLATSYQKLQQKVQKLFQQLWPKIKRGEAPRIRQSLEEGSCHYKRERHLFAPFIQAEGWNTPLRKIPFIGEKLKVT